MQKRPDSVLVVDDESHIRRLVGEYLTRQGLCVTCAGSGKEALEVFAAHRPHVVLTDVRMPGMDGIELLMAVKEQRPATAVIVMTGAAGENSAVDILRAGAAYYLRKPFRLEELDHLVRKCLSWFDPDAHPDIAVPFIQKETIEFRIPNDLSLVTPVVQFVWRRSRRSIGDAFAIPFRCGLEEIVINAIEHGNLGLTFREKEEALASNTYWDLIRERVQSPDRADRVVDLHYGRDPAQVRFTITDKGEGFDWRRWCQPVDLERLPGISGRGIFLARLHFSQVVYTDPGNRVTLTWKLDGPFPAED